MLLKWRVFQFPELPSLIHQNHTRAHRNCATALLLQRRWRRTPNRSLLYCIILLGFQPITPFPFPGWTDEMKGGKRFTGMESWSWFYWRIKQLCLRRPTTDDWHSPLWRCVRILILTKSDKCWNFCNYYYYKRNYFIKREFPKKIETKKRAEGWCLLLVRSCLPAGFQCPHPIMLLLLLFLL